MSNPNEGFHSSGTAQSEGAESEPSFKHRPFIEQESTPETTARAEFLDVALGEQSTENPTETQRAQHQEEFQIILDQWKDRLPDSAPMIEELQTAGNLHDFVADTWTSQDTEKQQAARELYRGVLQEYQGDWQDMPETNKRSLRLAEAGILMGDLVKAGVDMKAGQIDIKKLHSMAKRMERYKEGTDLPASFKKVLEGGSIALREEMKQEVGRQEQKKVRTFMPWEQGTLRDLGGKETPIVEPEPDEIKVVPSQQPKQPNPPAEEIIDAEFTPTPSTPKGLPYSPDVGGVRAGPGSAGSEG